MRVTYELTQAEVIQAAKDYLSYKTGVRIEQVDEVVINIPTNTPAAPYKVDVDGNPLGDATPIFSVRMSHTQDD